MGPQPLQNGQRHQSNGSYVKYSQLPQRKEQAALSLRELLKKFPHPLKFFIYAGNKRQRALTFNFHFFRRYSVAELCVREYAEDAEPHSR